MTSIAICNLALSNIGADNIQSITEASNEAQKCRQFYEPTLNALLQSYPWRFAEKRDVLAEIENTNDDWSKAFALPADYLKPLRLKGDAEYTVSGGVLYTNAEIATLSYIAKQDDPDRFPPMFADAFSWELAVKLAMPITRDPSIRSDAYQVARLLTEQAKVADANEVRTVWWPGEGLV